MAVRDASYLAIYGRPIGGGAVRRRPSNVIKAEITEAQGGCCLYCGLLIGSLVRRKGRTSATRTAWDHFMPYAYTVSNPRSNWVLACHICNGIKHSKIYETVREAQFAIRSRWLELGYEHVSAI